MKQFGECLKFSIADLNPGWIRIWNPDPDPGGQEKQKSKKLYKKNLH